MVPSMGPMLVLIADRNDPHHLKLVDGVRVRSFRLNTFCEIFCNSGLRPSRLKCMTYSCIVVTGGTLTRRVSISTELKRTGWRNALLFDATVDLSVNVVPKFIKQGGQ